MLLILFVIVAAACYASAIMVEYHIGGFAITANMLLMFITANVFAKKIQNGEY